jgi:hypothetical protein
MLDKQRYSCNLLNNGEVTKESLPLLECDFTRKIKVAADLALAAIQLPRFYVLNPTRIRVVRHQAIEFLGKEVFETLVLP